MRAATYIRESSREQAQGFSPAAQRRALKQYAEAQGMEIVATFEDFESGTKERRDGFQRMLAQAEAGDFEAVLCFHTSRFARNTEVARRSKRLLRAKGIKVVALNLPANLDPDSPEGHLLEGMSEVLDEHYSRQLGWWVRSGLREKFRQGQFVGLAPMGYKRDGDGRLIPSDASPLVQQAFLDYAGGLVSISQLARRLAQSGLRTAKHEPPSVSAVKYMLRNTTYTGRIRFKGEEQPGAVEPLIDHDTFEAVQARLQERRRGETKPTRYRMYALGGLLRCAACDSNWRGMVHRGVERYRCYGPGGRGCSGSVRVMKADALEEQVAERVIAGLSLDAATKTQVVDALRGRQPKFAEERRRLDAQLGRVRDMYELGDLSRDEYLGRSAAVKAQLATVPPIPLPIGAQDVLAELNGLTDRWPLLAPVAKRTLLRLLLRGMIIDNGVITAIHPKPEAMAVIAHLDKKPASSGRSRSGPSPGRCRRCGPGCSGCAGCACSSGASPACPP